MFSNLEYFTATHIVLYLYISIVYFSCLYQLKIEVSNTRKVDSNHPLLQQNIWIPRVQKSKSSATISNIKSIV